MLALKVVYLKLMEALRSDVFILQELGADGELVGARQGVEVQGAVALVVGSREGQTEDSVGPFEADSVHVELAGQRFCGKKSKYLLSNGVHIVVLRLSVTRSCDLRPWCGEKRFADFALIDWKEEIAEQGSHMRTRVAYVIRFKQKARFCERDVGSRLKTYKCHRN